MRIQLLNFGLRPELMPKRAHYNDAGADVFVPEFFGLPSGETKALPLKFGLALPDGYVGFIFPRSSLSRRGIICELPPIDSGYRGEVHAIVTNHSTEPYLAGIGDRIGQLVIMPVTIADFTTEAPMNQRGAGAFGSTGV